MGIVRFCILSDILLYLNGFKATYTKKAYIKFSWMAEKKAKPKELLLTLDISK